MGRGNNGEDGGDEGRRYGTGGSMKRFRSQAETDDQKIFINSRSRQDQTAIDHGRNRPLRTLQQSFGNQAVQELYKRGELDRPLSDDLQLDRTGRDESDAPTDGTPVSNESEYEGSGDSSATDGAGSDALTETAPDVGSESRDAEPESAEESTAHSQPTVNEDGSMSDVPNEDPEFQEVVQEIGSVAARERSHPPSEVPSAQAQRASESPDSEVTSKAAAEQVDEMDRQEPQAFDRAALKETLLRRLDATAPKTLEDADEFAESEALVSVKRDAVDTVETEASSVQAPIEETAKETPDTSSVEPKSTEPLQSPDVGSPPPDVGAARAAPKPKPDSEVSTPFEERRRTLDRQLEAADVTEEQLEKANEPAFSAKREAETHAAEAPDAYREHEEGTLSTAETEMVDAAQSQLQSMHGTRGTLLDQVGTLQEQTKGEDEQKRAEVATHILSVYEATTQQVTERLDTLDEEVTAEFDTGAEAARVAFETYVEEQLRAYKKARYSGAAGWARWGKDKLLGLPDEVEQFYVEGQRRYLAAMDETIDRVVDTLATGLSEAQETIAEGRQEIATYVADLPESLRKVGEAAASDVGSRFDELEQRIHGTKDQLIDSLAQTYTEHRQAMDSRIEALRAENRGLVDRALDAVGSVVQTVLQLKSLLLGVLGKATAAIGTIIGDPIGVLGNLVAGVTRGLENFVANVWTHLQTGLIDWLMGTVAEAGIQLPERFDLAGIFSLVTQVLGLTYENVRARAVSVLGERTVTALEGTFEIFRVLLTEGVAGLWTYVQGKIGDLQAMVLDKIRELVATQVVQAGIKWIVGLLGPVGAFVKACMVIYDVVTFFVQRARQVAALVESVLDSILAIAQGNLGTVASYVENALAGSISVLIGFLANLIGLRGLPTKVRDVIESVRQPIDRGIQWVIEQARDAAKRLGGALGFGGETTGKGVEERPEVPDRENTVPAGLSAIDAYEEQLAENGRLTHGDAEQIAARVKSEYPVFTELSIVEGETTWDYRYAASPGKRKSGLPKAEEAADVAPASVWDEIIDRMASAQEEETRLSQTSVTNARKVLFSLIKRSSAPPTEQRDAKAAVDGLLGEASEQRDGDRIYSKVRQAQGVVNSLLRQHQVDIQLQTHHIERVAENVDTFVETKRGRLYIPVRYKRAVEEWVSNLGGLSTSEIETQRRELVGLIRDQLLDDRRVHFEKKLEEINLAIVTREQHARIHREEREQERKR